MADDKINKKCDEMLHDVADKNPNLASKIGMGNEGPIKGSVAARAQANQGNIAKGSDFADLQEKQMKHN